ncbi:DUF1684 domain-containing protein [Microbacterium paludicola]|uniref:DUF1684 domain-containing protein n=1 Tax=Microbacterium paludicola TaxID=300019 RepID=UPI000A04064C|nr:DUF1684 domain-containing protein [Microbacterium paludicola]
MSTTTDDRIPGGTIDRAAFGRDWETWHREHEARRADPHGFLAVTGLHWLGDAAVTLPDAPGTWTLGPDGPVVRLADGETLDLDGETLRGEHAFGDIPERGGVNLGFVDGDVTGVIELAQRGGHTIVRPRRPDHPFLASYTGTPTYVSNPRWRVAARFRAFDEPRPTTVGAAVDGLTHVYDAPGVLEFEWRGETFSLTAFPGHAGPGSLLVLFTDATSGLTTYAANRSVSVAAPDADGWTVIDFNRAVNLPCAYTDHATCPLPPAENRLPIGIEAGEKTPLARVSADTEVSR